MKKVYIVTDGEYSNYRIVAVFSKEEEANKFVEHCNTDSYYSCRIEEYELDTDIVTDRNPYRVVMYRNGDVGEVNPEHDFNVKPRIMFSAFFNYDARPLQRKDTLYAIVFAKDRDHAIKIVNEKRLQLIAMNAWEDRKVATGYLSMSKEIEAQLLDGEDER